jgi:drug/metabolite transporter (DMT)-like permease
MLRSDNLRAATLMVVSMALFAVEDTLLKVVSRAVPVGEILVFLGVTGTAAFWAMAARAGVPFLSRRALTGAVLARNAGEFAGTIGIVTALSLIPLSTASAILQAAPLVVTMGAALVLGEVVRWRRWAAVLVGLAGVLIILRPGTEGFDANALWAVLGVLGLSVRDVASRRTPADLHSLQVAAWGFASVIFAGLLLMAVGPSPVIPPSWALATMAVTVTIGVVAYFMIVTATRMGDVSLVAPFRYARIVFAMALGALVFGERPDGPMILGCLLIVASGLYTFAREARLKRAGGSAAAQASPATDQPL